MKNFRTLNNSNDKKSSMFASMNYNHQGKEIEH